MLQNRYNYYVIAFIAIILGNLFSQNNSISGWVIDYETNKPIKDVSVYIKQSNLRTSSDEEGYFDLYVCPKCNISIDEQNDIKEIIIAFELIGYENKVINFSDFTNQTKIFLNKQSIELKSIHVHDEYIHQRDILLDSRKIDENKTDIEFQTGKLSIFIDEKDSIHMKGPVSKIKEIEIKL